MRERTIKVYNCEYCNKLYQRKHACENHETDCSKNPENKRPCFGCEHLTKKKTLAAFDSYMLGEVLEEVEILYCNKMKHFLCPPKSERKGLWYDAGKDDEYNRPMPKTCTERKAKYIYREEPSH